MSCLHIIVLPQAEEIRLAAGDGLELPAGASCYGFTASALQPAYREMQHLLDGRTPFIVSDRCLQISATPEMLLAVEQLARTDTEAMLRFVLSYCLVVDGPRCASLLHFLVASDLGLFDFIHRHRLEPWPVARYADVLELPRRKFNQLFKEKYGVSAKHWLLEQRLEHARRQLETTSKKIIDIALESGFCNAAHFSDSFRLHFRMSPSEARRGLPQAATPLF